MEQLLNKLREVEQELEKIKKERALLLKRIPCTLEGCNRGKECENSHRLRYEDRSEPKSNKWRKTIPCRYYLQGRCDKEDDKCDWRHERPGGSRRTMEDEENERSFNDMMDRQFRQIRRESETADSSVEIMDEVNGQGYERSWSRRGERREYEREERGWQNGAC